MFKSAHLNIYVPPSIGCHYTVIPNTLPSSQIGQFIGKNGKVFKAINKRFEKQGCLYIWFNNEKNVTEVYSNSHQTALNVRQAILERSDRIQFLSSKGK
jgi:hypothetical protein